MSMPSDESGSFAKMTPFFTPDTIVYSVEMYLVRASGGGKGANLRVQLRTLYSEPSQGTETRKPPRRRVRVCARQKFAFSSCVADALCGSDASDGGVVVCRLFHDLPEAPTVQRPACNRTATGPQQDDDV